MYNNFSRNPALYEIMCKNW